MGDHQPTVHPNPDRKSKCTDEVLLNVPSSKGLPAQDNQRPWFKGYGTIKDKRTIVCHQSGHLIEELSTKSKELLLPLA